MLKIQTTVRSAKTGLNNEFSQDKTMRTPAYRAPRVIEVGKASTLLQGYTYGGFRDCYGWYSFSPWH